MDNDSKKSLSKQRILQIVLPAAFVLIVAGIWFAKNYEPPITTDVPVSSTPASSQPVFSEPSEDEEEAECCDSSSEGSLSSEVEKKEITSEDAAMTVGDDIDLEQLTSYGVPVILKFGAEWCGPCQAFAPILEEVHKEYAGKVIIKDIDVDEKPDITQQFPVSVVPTMVLFDSKGRPYVSDDDSLDLTFKYYSTKSTGEHIYTTMEGAINKDRLLALLKNMGMET